MQNKLFTNIALICVFSLGSLSTFAQAENDESSTPLPRHKAGKHLMKQMQKMDTNEDSQVDLAEYLAHAEARFRRLDADGDGYITKDERRSAHQQMRKKVRERREKWREQREQFDNEADDS